MATPLKFARLYTLGLIALFAPVVVLAGDASAPIPYFGMSPNDVATLNAAFRKALIGQDAATAAVFAAHPTYGPYQNNTAIMPTPFNPQRHDGFVEIAKKGDIDLLFDGDSI